MQVVVEILDERRREVVAGFVAVPPDQALDLREVVWCVAPQHIDQFVNRDRAFAVAGEIDSDFAERTFRERSDVAADNDDALIRIAILDRKASRTRRRHLLRRRRRLMAEHDHADQRRLARGDDVGHSLGIKLVCLGIDDVDRITAVADVAGDQAAPQRWLD